MKLKIYITRCYLLAALSFPLLAPAEKYSPQFFSPKRTGDCYWFQDQRTISNQSIITENAKVIDSQQGTFTSFLEANVCVLRNNATGKATEERFDVIKFTVSINGEEPQQMLEPGTRFYGRLELGEKVFTDVDGNELSPQAKVFLKQIIALRDNSITDQDIFASDDPIAVGDSWSINNRLAADDFNFDMTMRADPKYLTGQSALLDTSVIDGNTYLHILTEMQMTHAQLPKAAGMRTIKGELDFSSEVWLPQQGPVFPREQRMEMSLSFITEPMTQQRFTKRRMMANSSVSATVKAKPLPRDESVTELDRTLGIRR